MGEQRVPDEFVEDDDRNDDMVGAELADPQRIGQVHGSVEEVDLRIGRRACGGAYTVRPYPSAVSAMDSGRGQATATEETNVIREAGREMPDGSRLWRSGRVGATVTHPRTTRPVTPGGPR